GPASEEQIADQAGQERGKKDGNFQVVNVVLDEGGGVEIDGHVVSGGHFLKNLVHALLGGVGHRHGVVAVLHDDSQPHGRHSVKAGNAGDGRQTVLDVRHFLEFGDHVIG